MKTFVEKTIVLKGDTFDVGEKVKVEGEYICVPCGYKRKYNQGEIFQRCFHCLKGIQDEGKPFIKNLDLWEYIG